MRLVYLTVRSGVHKAKNPRIRLEKDGSGYNDAHTCL